MLTVVKGRALGAVVKVTFVGRSSDDGGHGRNIETKKTTTNHGDSRDGVEVPDNHVG
jgi:hypothetical protein